MNKMSITCLFFAVAASGAHAEITLPTQRVNPPTETKSKESLRQETLDERTKKAVKETSKSRAYLVDASIVFLPEESSRPRIPGASTLATEFCGRGEGSRFAVVRLRYEWRPPIGNILVKKRPDGTVVGDFYVHQGQAVVRLADREISRSVQLGPRGGELEIGGSTAPLTGLMLSTRDLCPTGCTQVRLAPRSAAHANRFDQRWRRACLR